MFSLMFGTLTGCGEPEKTELTELEIIPIENEDETENSVAAEGEVLKIGVMDATSKELLNQAKTFMEEKGCALDTVEYEDSELMNRDLMDHNIQGHLFVHQPYLNSYNLGAENPLYSLGVLWYEVYGMYPGLKDDLTNLQQGDSIAVPQESSAQARALLFLQELGYITLKEGQGEWLNLDDVTENPRELVFTAVPEEELSAEGEPPADFIICGGYSAVLAGRDILKDALAVEKMDMDGVQLFGIQLVTDESQKDSPALKTLKEVFAGEELQPYLKYMLKGTVATR